MDQRTFIKIAFLVVITGVALYIILPKYHFEYKGFARCNTITGKVETFNGNTKSWENVLSPHKK